MIRVVHVGFHLDRQRRPPEALLEAWPTLTGVATAVARAGLDVAVVQPAHRDATLERDDVTYRFVRERPALLRRGTPGTRPVRAPAAATLEAVAAFEPAVVHLNGLALPAFVRRLADRIGAPILAQDHADRPPAPWRRPAARRAMRACDAVAFTAREQAEPFFDAGLFLAGLPVHEVPESSTDLCEDPAAPRHDFPGDPCLAWVGHLDRNKDPLTVLDGLAAATPDLPDARLWCCFLEAPLLASVERRIAADPRLRGRVRLLGPCDRGRVESLLRSADALVLGSHREGSGYTVIEAMACGATPVVTDIPSFRKLTGDVGLLWRAGDALDLRRALLRLAERDETARRRVRDRFERALSWDAVGSRLAEIYRALAARRPGEAGTP